MPQCKAKYCTTKRGEGKHTYAIPDPKKKYELCAKWIHNLGIINLDIKTYIYNSSNIVCEDHFEEDCFEANMQAKLMGYTPQFKKLKENAVPTIFKDTVKPKARESSIRRKRKAEQQEVIDSLLSDEPELLPSTSVEVSTEPLVLVNCPEVEINNYTKGKQKSKRKTQVKKTKQEMKEKLMVDKCIQVAPPMTCASSSCSIRADEPLTECPNCYIRDNPTTAHSDHSYHSYTGNKLSESIGCNSTQTSTPIKKDNLQKILLPITPQKYDDLLSDIEESPVKQDSYTEDPSFHMPDISVDSDNSENENDEDEDDISNSSVKDTKLIVFLSCLYTLFGFIKCPECSEGLCHEDTKEYMNGTCITLSFTCLRGHTFSWRSQPLIGKQPVGNVLVSTATFITGSGYTTMSNFSKL